MKKIMISILALLMSVGAYAQQQPDPTEPDPGRRERRCRGNSGAEGEERRCRRNNQRRRMSPYKVYASEQHRENHQKMIKFRGLGAKRMYRHLGSQEGGSVAPVQLEEGVFQKVGENITCTKKRRRFFCEATLNSDGSFAPGAAG